MLGTRDLVVMLLGLEDFDCKKCDGHTFFSLLAGVGVYGRRRCYGRQFSFESMICAIVGSFFNLAIAHVGATEVTKYKTLNLTRSAAAGSKQTYQFFASGGAIQLTPTIFLENSVLPTFHTDDFKGSARATFPRRRIKALHST